MKRDQGGEVCVAWRWTAGRRYCFGAEAGHPARLGRRSGRERRRRGGRYGGGRWLAALALSAAFWVASPAVMAQWQGWSWVAPSAGTVWTAGSTVTLQWQTPAPGSFVLLRLLDAQTGQVLPSNVSGLPPAGVYNTHSHVWTIPAGLPGGTYRLWVAANNILHQPYAYSDDFLIIPRPEAGGPVAKNGPDLTVTKKALDPVVAGQQITYQIVVSNVGTAPTPNYFIDVWDTLSPGLTYVSITGSGWNCSAGTTIGCTYFGSVLAGTSLPPITLTVQVAAGAGEVKNCAVVKMTKLTGLPLSAIVVPDANPSNDETCAVSVVGADLKPDLAVEKTLEGGAFQPNGMGAYTISVTNAGNVPASNLVVSDTLGAGLTLISAVGGGWSCTPVPVTGPATVSCTYPGTLGPGQSTQIVINVQLASGFTGVAENCARVAIKADTPWFPDVNPGDNLSCVTTEVGGGKAPDLAIAKKPTGPLVAGQQASYQIVVSNLGTADAPGPIVVTDTLGAGLSYVFASGTGWSCTASGQTVTCTHPGPVPAGGGLPPITLTVQVAADAKEVKNCARVKAGTGPAKDAPAEANLHNNEACVVSPAEPGEKTGKVCGVKFLDHDGDGTWDANEPGLPNWTIQVKDAAGNLAGSVTTGPKGRFCIEVKPGTYTVAEVVKPGWVQTAPQPVPPGTAAVTVAAGQTAVVQFGNRPEKKPCCLDFTWQGGKADQFSTADGATAEPAVPPPGQPLAYFDQTQADQWFRHRFILPEGQCLREAKLELLVRPLHRMPVGVSSSRNDTIVLSAGSGTWGAKFGPSGPAAVTNQLSATEWVLDNWPGGMTLTLDLASLPGGGSLLAALDAARTLDIVLQDDTSVDYARLVVRFCDCAEKEKEALGAAARGGAREIVLPLGPICLGKDDDCDGWVEKAGAPHDASISIVRNIPGRRIMLVGGAPRPLDAPPVIRGGRTFLPVRALAEALGLDVAWDANEKKVTLTGDDRVVALWVGKPKAVIREGGRTVGAGQITEIIKRTQGPGSGGGEGPAETAHEGVDIFLKCDHNCLEAAIDPANPDVVPFIENGRVMLPLRFIAEALELDVSFESETQQVTIKRPSRMCTRRDKNGNCVEWAEFTS